MLVLGFIAWFLGMYPMAKALQVFGWFTHGKVCEYVFWILLSLFWPVTMVLGGALLLIVEAFCK